MKAYTDLHIHSALSPCASNEMTPNNIVNMAWLKGVDIIAVTDHNSASNCEAISKCAQERGILAIPGMEIETREEVHLVCLFPEVEAALKMQEKIYECLPDVQNRVDVFGEQLILNTDDEIIGNIDRMLMTAADIGVEEVFKEMDLLGGIVIPAHVDRSSYSLLSNLGFVPQELNIRYLEISHNCSLAKLISKNEGLSKYNFIKSSDAHRLGDILEKEYYLDLKDISIKSLFEVLKS